MKTTLVYAKDTLRKIRIRRGYTLDAFSKKIGYSAAGYGKVELKRNGMNPKGVLQVMKTLNLEFDDLFEFIDTEEND